MFTGIIEGLGEVVSLSPFKDGKVLTLALPFSSDGLTVGQSISINGVCLTLTRTEKDKGAFFFSHTTAKTSNLNRLRIGDKVNLERALRLNQELGGHLLAGHVDEMSAVQAMQGRDIRFSIPEQTGRFLVTKGSIAIDGISLTIASIEKDHFLVTIIPHTWENTNIKYRRPGDMVNIEADIIAKYVWRYLNSMQGLQNSPASQGLMREKLQASGFLFEDQKNEI